MWGSMPSPIRSLFGVVAALLLCVFVTAKAGAQSVPLTDEQRAWIDAHPSLIVANELDWPPFDFAEDGEPMGFSIDVIRLVAAKVGLEIELVNGFTWAELLEMFKRGEIDVLPAIFASPERREFIAFTEEYTTNPSILVVAEDDVETSTHRIQPSGPE